MTEISFRDPSVVFVLVNTGERTVAACKSENEAKTLARALAQCFHSNVKYWQLSAGDASAVTVNAEGIEQ